MKVFNYQRFLFSPADGEGEGGGGGGTSFEQIVAEHSDGGDPGDENDGETDDQDHDNDELENDQDYEEEDSEDQEEEDDKEESELDKLLKSAKTKTDGKEDKQTLAVLNKALGKELQVKSMDELRDLVEEGKKGKALMAEIAEQKQQFAAEAKLVVKKLAERTKEIEKERESFKTIKKEHWIADRAFAMLKDYDPEAYESFVRVMQHVSPYYKEETKEKNGVLTKEDIKKAIEEKEQERELMMAKNEWAKGWGSLAPKIKELKRLGINVSEKLVQKEWVKDDNISVEKALLKAYAQEITSLTKKKLSKSEKSNILQMRDANLIGRNLGMRKKASGRQVLDYDTFLSKF